MLPVSLPAEDIQPATCSYYYRHIPSNQPAWRLTGTPQEGISVQLYPHGLNFLKPFQGCMPAIGGKQRQINTDKNTYNRIREFLQTTGTDP
jgi:hypothetical protein